MQKVDLVHCFLPETYLSFDTADAGVIGRALAVLMSVANSPQFKAKSCENGKHVA